LGGAVTANSPATTILALAGTQGGGNIITNLPSATATLDLMGSPGGESPFGGSGKSQSVGSTASAAVANTGSGGGGAAFTDNSGTFRTGSGGGSGGYLEAIISTPLASYSYTVGAGGSGQAAGTNGLAGGNGAAGVIIVEEWYG
jgi:hypothetical protein